jgi:hypothetical protein
MKRLIKAILITEDGRKINLEIETFKEFTHGYELYELIAEIVPDLLQVKFSHDGYETIYRNGLETVIIYDTYN